MSKRKYKQNDSYFSVIDTEEKAYFLGLLYADGNVSNQYSSSYIFLSSKDLGIIKRFKKALKTNRVIYEEFHHKFQKSIFKLRVTSKIMFDDLVRLGCVPRKSLILKFPTTQQVPKKYISHFIRGYFDGDGTVGSYPTGKNKLWCRLVSGFCGTKAVLSGINKHLKSDKKIKQAGGRNLYLLNFSVFDSLNLYYYMYKDATVWLPRKRTIFEKYLKQRSSTTTIDNPSLYPGMVIKTRIKV